jgi:hypothetical protein
MINPQWGFNPIIIRMLFAVTLFQHRDSDEKRVVLRGMSMGAPRTVSAKRMERIFRHGEVAYATECLITSQKDSKGRQRYQIEMRNLLGRYQQVFCSIPPGRPPDKGFEHTIELEGAKPMITTPYCHPRRFKDEIKKAIKELLAMGHIRLSNSCNVPNPTFLLGTLTNH